MASIAKFDTWQNSAGVNYGTVLQVVQTSAGGTETTINGVASPTVLSASITPRFTTSKVLILIHSSGACDPTSSDYSFGERISRNGTQVYFNGERIYGNIATMIIESWSTNYLDSPSSISALTYTYAMVGSNRGQVRYNRGGSGSSGATMTLLEIAA
jgi:hypothetical protein